MNNNRLILAATTLIVVLSFFISPVLACNYPGPEGSSITVTVHTSDGTPLPGASVTLYVYNGSKQVTSVGPEGTNNNGQFTFPGPSDIVNGLTYKIHASYNGDQVSIECTDQQHSADSGTFTLSAGQNKAVDITIQGVTVKHGGDGGATATPGPAKDPEPTVKPIVPKGNHSSYPPMASGDNPGSISGVILSNESSDPICGAYVAVVSAVGTDVEYSCMYTDRNGFYQFNGVNSTTDAVYKILVTDGCGDVAYSCPFKVGSGESVQVNLNLGKKECPPDTPATPTPTLEPTTTPPADNNTTVTSAQTMSVKDMGHDASVQHENPGILDQITGFLGSIIANIMGK